MKIGGATWLWILGILCIVFFLIAVTFAFFIAIDGAIIYDLCASDEAMTDLVNTVIPDLEMLYELEPSEPIEYHPSCEGIL